MVVIETEDGKGSLKMTAFSEMKVNRKNRICARLSREHMI
ncbi:MAG: hypothetical protein A4E48_00762 [Methanosaeta sp. PtaU1.Bin060]|nr:MAG: hypothetical protein A4E48_00762 [Methanosaeta sp. PtaU1.Bin060]